MAHVLVIDDDFAIREMLRHILEIYGYEVSTASNGQEGLDSLAHQPLPCLILLDLMMPVMDGWQFMEAKGRQPPLGKVPVVLVSAFTERASEILCQGMLPKPIALDNLLSTVGKFCVAS